MTTADRTRPAPPAHPALPLRPALWRRALAEFVGAALLVAVVVGSGIAAQRLSSDVGLQLLENSFATALGLAAIILMFQGLSGSHLNPVVTLVDTVLGESPRRWADVGAYLPAQLSGGVAGSLLANAMFGVPAALATTERVDAGRIVGEVIATAGLVLLIFALVRSGRAAIVAPAVGAYIGAAYWFTSSTSFANPAVTVGRVFSDTFAGIAPGSAPWFVAAQLVGGAVGWVLVVVLAPTAQAPAPSR